MKNLNRIIFLCVVSFLWVLLTFLLAHQSSVFAQTTIESLPEDLLDEGFQGEYRLPTRDDYKMSETLYQPLPSFSNQNTLPSIRSSDASAGKPNIIVILTDDQPPDSLGIAGNPIIKTPHIDALGNSGGMYFKNTYTTTPICSPSRASLLTGKLPHAHGIMWNFLTLPNNQLTIAEILGSNGYDTALIGKCHLGNPRDLGFAHSVMTEAWPSWVLGGPYPVVRNGVAETQTTYHTTFLTNEAIAYLTSKIDAQSSSNKPFFLWLAFNAPHIHNRPPDNPNRYNVNQFTAPVSLTDDLSSKPPAQKYQDPHQVYNPTNNPALNRFVGQMTWDTIRQQKELAYEEISMIDDSVGRIKSLLQTKGVADNTIIVYLSDNGLFYGEHQLFQKAAYFYEEQVKTPLIINYPRIITQSGTKTPLVSTLDLMPTLLTMVGLTPPGDIHGKSLLPFLRGQTSIHRNSVYMQFHSINGQSDRYFPMRGLVMDRFKLVHYIFASDVKTAIDGTQFTIDGRDYEFYNLASDPFEMNNLARRNGPNDIPLNRLRNDPTYGRQVRKMLREIAVWQKDTVDPVARIMTNFRVTRLSPTSYQFNWTSPEPLTSELTYKVANCASCEASELQDFRLTTDHTMTLSNLQQNTQYEITVFSISENGNGTYERYIAADRKPGDFDNDGDVDVFDYNILVGNFGRPYTIFDYNNLVSNFGK